MAKRQKSAHEDDYAISKPESGRRLRAPALPYKPGRPKSYKPRIGVIGCGGIVATQLQAYRNAKYPVVGLTDLVSERAESYRERFYPRAVVYASAEQLLAEPDIDVVDIATHAEERPPLVMAAIRAGKHVLSQKPYVTDLSVGRKLAAAARRKGVKLAVNQNGRWAAHVSYARQAIAAGLLGDVTSVDMSVHWDHNWVADTPFNRIKQLLLYDFCIHWFDMLHCYSGGRKARQVSAKVYRTKSQKARPPLSGHAIVEYPDLQASIVLRGDSLCGAQDRTIIVGTKGTLISCGPNINEQAITLYTPEGTASPKLTTRWFPDGFDGAMSELVCAIEEDREPYHSARDNLRSLGLCFAAIKSAETGQPVSV
jgi:predicted dehydrogenase